MKNVLLKSAVAASVFFSSWAIAGGHMMSVIGMDQDVSGGTVTASEVKSEQNGWLVVHRTDGTGKPGPVVGYSPLRKGLNTDVVAILTEEIAKGDRLMLMLHGEEGGNSAGIFEYTLGAKEDGPIKRQGKLVMSIITAQ
ncbi:hypothetical protein AB833_01845 [Chromatiales bacterium (ex Bugula neritina AB1)]|nr:hypothetical protein AB833_01845 [Chromatiales bacterium (ex Bugula neritina AB1)]